MECRMCPRLCGADRDGGDAGVCGIARRNTVRVARAALHFWEEPCISGQRGSGAVFFSGCPLHCVYCQNAEISRGEAGIELTEDKLVKAYLKLEREGAHNINLVTGTHYSDAIARSVRTARAKGLSLPVIFNCGGYERVETLRSLDGVVDIYMPDFKYFYADTAGRYSAAPDYPEVAMAALDEMVRRRGEPVLDPDGIMLSGVIVRHLVLPGCAEESKRIIEYIYDRYRDSVYISIMSQYTPPPGLSLDELGRTVTAEEYDSVVDHAVDIGVTRAFIQDGEAASESFIPPFDLTGVAEL